MRFYVRAKLGRLAFGFSFRTQKIFQGFGGNGEANRGGPRPKEPERKRSRFSLANDNVLGRTNQDLST